MEIRSTKTILAISLLFLLGTVACSEDPYTKTQPASSMANPCAMKQNPCAMKNPCAGQNPCGLKNPCAGKPAAGIDPSRITRPADVKPYTGDSRSALVVEGKKLFEDSSLSSNGSSCNSCHATNGMFNAGFAEPYPHPVAMAKDKAGLDRALQADEFVQFCMIVPMAAEPLPWDSKELAALTAYVVDVKQKEFIAASNGNPCAMKNPCAGKNPCAMKNPCGVTH